MDTTKPNKHLTSTMYDTHLLTYPVRQQTVIPNGQHVMHDTTDHTKKRRVHFTVVSDTVYWIAFTC